MIFYLSSGKPLYLLLYGVGYWGFTKGLIEEGESEEETALREAEEEAGLKIKIIHDFKEKINYMYKLHGDLIKKEVIFLVAEANSKGVKLSHEHSDFKWLPFEEALKLMKYKNQKELLKKANAFILEKLKQKKLL